MGCLNKINNGPIGGKSGEPRQDFVQGSGLTGSRFFVHKPGLPDFLGPSIPNYTKRPYIIPNGHKLYQMAIKYVKVPTFCIPRPSKIYQNWYFWFENSHLATLLPR
jgi:hypothetical protein